MLPELCFATGLSEDLKDYFQLKKFLIFYNKLKNAFLLILKEFKDLKNNLA